eukprot:3949818-Amphidinium_carterae.1
MPASAEDESMGDPLPPSGSSSPLPPPPLGHDLALPEVLPPGIAVLPAPTRHARNVVAHPFNQQHVAPPAFTNRLTELAA